MLVLLMLMLLSPEKGQSVVDATRNDMAGDSQSRSGVIAYEEKGRLELPMMKVDLYTQVHADLATPRLKYVKKNATYSYDGSNFYGKGPNEAGGFTYSASSMRDSWTQTWPVILLNQTVEWRYLADAPVQTDEGQIVAAVHFEGKPIMYLTIDPEEKRVQGMYFLNEKGAITDTVFITAHETQLGMVVPKSVSYELKGKGELTVTYDNWRMEQVAEGFFAQVE